MRISFDFESSYITNDKLALNTSLLHEYYQFFDNLTVSFDYTILKYIEYYSNQVIVLPESSKTEKSIAYPFLNMFIEDLNLIFTCNFPYIQDFLKSGYKKQKLGNSYYIIIQLQTSQIKKDNEKVINLLKQDPNYMYIIEFFNKYSVDIVLYYKSDEKTYEENESMVDYVYDIWKKGQHIFSYNKEDHEYKTNLSYNKLTSGVYYINTKTKTTDALANLLYFPVKEPIKILSFFDYEYELSYYFEQVTDIDNLKIKFFPAVCYTIDNINAILQLTNVYIFLCPKNKICPYYSNITYEDLYYSYIKDKELFKPLFKIWKDFLKVITIFLDGNKNKMDLDKYNEAFELSQKWLGNYKAYMDSYRDTNKLLYETLKKLTIPQYESFEKSGEYIIKGIEQISNIIINRAIPELYQPIDVENLLRGLLFIIFNNFMTTEYKPDNVNKFNSNIIYKGFIPIYRSPFHILGNIVNSIGPNDSDDKGNINIKSKIRTYEQSIDKFLKKGYNSYADKINKEMEIDKIKDQIEKDTALNIVKEYILPDLEIKNPDIIKKIENDFKINLSDHDIDIEKEFKDRMEIDIAEKEEEKKLKLLTEEKEKLNKTIQEYKNKIEKLNEKINNQKSLMDNTITKDIAERQLNDLKKKYEIDLINSSEEYKQKINELTNQLNDKQISYEKTILEYDKYKKESEKKIKEINDNYTQQIKELKESKDLSASELTEKYNKYKEEHKED